MEQGFPDANMELTHILVVSNIARSRSFYVDVLGAELYREYGGSSIVLRFLGNWLLLVTGGGPTEDKPAVRFAPPPDPDTVSASFTIRVGDCHRAYETLMARGAQFLTPPKDWGGEIRCFFRDPDGHLFEISQATLAGAGQFAPGLDFGANGPEARRSGPA
jgi:catechol 2,3-dioxygenase-like lactoylglutathione lyase family enzyme